MEPKPVNAVTKGIVISLILIVLSLLIVILNIDPQGWTQYLGYLIFFGGLILGMWYFAKQLNYNATFGKYFAHGFAIVAIVTALMIIFTAIEISAFPNLKETIIQKSAEKIQNNPKLTDEQIKQSQVGFEFFKKHFLMFMISGVLFSFIFFGTLVALITAAVIKKNPRPIFEDDLEKVG